jgi:hypothetical protein
VVALAVVAARIGGTLPDESLLGRDVEIKERRLSGPRTALAGVMLGAGALLAVAGVEPSRLSASLLIGALGAGAFGALDAARIAMFLVGGALVLGGMTVLLADHRVAGGARLAVPSVLLAAGAATGIASALVQATGAGRLLEGAAVLTGASGTIGGGLGLLVAALLIARAGGRLIVAVAGSVLLVLGAGLGLAVLSAQRPDVGDLRPVGLIGLVGFGGALVVTALRHRLADADPGARGLAASAGVAAAAIGASIGSMVGAGEGLQMLGGGVRGPGPGSIGLLVASLAVAALSAALPRAERRTLAADS